MNEGIKYFYVKAGKPGLHAIRLLRIVIKRTDLNGIDLIIF